MEHQLDQLEYDLFRARVAAETVYNNPTLSRLRDEIINMYAAGDSAIGPIGACEIIMHIAIDLAHNQPN
jgi:hypothetical protein